MKLSPVEDSLITEMDSMLVWRFHSKPQSVLAWLISSSSVALQITIYRIKAGATLVPAFNDRLQE